TVHDGESVSAGLAGDIEQRRRFSIAGNDANMVFSPQRNCGQIANSQTVRDDNGRDVFRSTRFLRGHDQILFIVLRQSPNRTYSGSLPDRIGEVIIREPLRGQAGWIGDDLDLAD